MFIFLAFLGIVLYVRGSNPTTNDEVAQLVSKEGKQTRDQIEALRRELSRVDEEQSQYDHFEKFSLGYVLFAWSGTEEIALPHTNVFEGDWNGIKVSRDDARDDFAWIDIPYLRDKRTNSAVIVTSLGIKLEPNSKSIRYRFKGSFTAQVECLKASPVGFYFVLGFAEDIEGN